MSASTQDGRQGEARRCLVMTGGTSGIGRRVVERLLHGGPDWHIVLLARPSPRLDELRGRLAAGERLSVVCVDLASLKSVDRACDEIAERLGCNSIDALALNAGVQTVRSDASSADGLELSFAVNYLAHVLIAERLKGLLRPRGRIIFTTSEVHDPGAFCLMGIGRATWQDPLLLADPARSQDHVDSQVDRGEARYCASKLLCLMYVRYLARVSPNIEVIAFNPSVVAGTEIARDRNWLQQLGWKYVMPLLTPILPGTRSLERSSTDLLWLVTETNARWLTGQYVDGRVAQRGSDESRERAKILRSVEVANALLRDHLPAPLLHRVANGGAPQAD